MDRLHSYPKVYALGHPALADLFDGPVTVEEKVDGSQFSFGFIDGDIKFRSKGAEIFHEAPDKMFARGVEAVMDIHHLLTPGWVYRGEYLRKPKHNHLAYERVPTNHVVIFDVETEPNRFLDPLDKMVEASRLGFDFIPSLLEAQNVGNAEAFRLLLGHDSYLGGPKVEGVVVKNYARFGRDGKILAGKFVSEAFKESQKLSWKKDNPTGKDIIQTISEGLRSEARFRKAVQHLRESGQLTGTPKDIGPLIKELQRDLAEEEAENVKEALYRWAWGNVQRGATRGLAEWYKQRLLEAQFNDDASIQECYL